MLTLRVARKDVHKTSYNGDTVEILISDDASFEIVNTQGPITKQVSSTTQNAPKTNASRQQTGTNTNAVEYARRILKDSGRKIRTADLAQEMLALGWKTDAKNLSDRVYQSLRRSDEEFEIANGFWSYKTAEHAEPEPPEQTNPSSEPSQVQPPSADTNGNMNPATEAPHVPDGQIFNQQPAQA